MIEVVVFLAPYIVVSLLLGFIVLWGLGLLGAVPGFPTWGELLQALARHSSIFRRKVKQVFRDFGSRWAQARKYARLKLRNEKTRLAATALVGFSLVGAVVGGWYLLDMHEGAELGADAYSMATRDRSIAVMPFENMGGEESSRFTQGVHDDLLARLSNVSELQVVSRSSVQQYRHSEMTAGEIASELGVRWVLQGGVQRMGDQIQVNAQLIDPSTDTQVWANTYRRELTTENLIEVQNEITQKIARALQAELTTGERQRVERHPTEDLAAYDAYLRGRNQWWQFWGSFNCAALERALGHLREAVRRDSTFAEAHAWRGAAFAHFDECAGAPGPDSRWGDSASAAVERARSLDPKLAQAYLAQSFVTRDSLAKRVEALRRAVELQPSYAFAMAELSDALERQGRFVEAVQAAHEAVRLDPRDPAVHQEMADQLREVGLYDAAEAWDRRALEVEPGHIQALFGLMQTQLYRGDAEQALQTGQRLVDQQEVGFSGGFWLRAAAGTALQAGHPARAKTFLEQVLERLPEATPGDAQYSRLWAELGLTELRLDNRERGRELLQQVADSARTELQEATGDSTGALALLAESQAALGQRDEALEYLERLWETEPNWRRWILVSPFFDDDLRSDPRFQKIVREIEAEREKLREKVRQLGIDLYPPGAEPDTARVQPQTDR